MSASLERRQFFKFVALLTGGVGALGESAAASARKPDAPSVTGSLQADETAVHWLDGLPGSFQGTTWGVPWPQGRVPGDAAFELRPASNVAQPSAARPVQSWPLAYWPDGSLKWSAHALTPDATGAAPENGYTLHPLLDASGRALRVSDAATHMASEVNRPVPAAAGLLAAERDGSIVVDTGALQCTVARQGAVLLSAVRRQGQQLLQDGRLVLLVDGAAEDEGKAVARRAFDGTIESAVLEQNGAQRAVVRVTGSHTHADGSKLLPFTVRLYFYKNSDAIRVVHTLVYDADPQQAFIRGIGLRFGMPLSAPMHDRYVRFVGANGGVFAEAVQGLTGLRRDAGAAAEAQLQGRAVAPGSLPGNVSKNLRYVPAFGSYTLLQSHPDGYSISKRTSPGHGWIHAASGGRAAGTAYLGTPEGGVAFGVRNFWQSYPGQIDIHGAETSQATVTLWLWAPKAQPMDLRFYHDGMGETDHAKQRDALDITYEDYEPEFGTPYGVARTSELELQLFSSTPTHEQLVAISQRIQSPPLLTASPQRLHSAGVFSEYWHPAAAKPTRLDQQLGWAFDFYRNQIEDRRWYGYWDYGDVMHTYDTQRHVWRYDVGGFAWDNSELSTEIWLWHYYLHSGRADAYRVAEAMTRHTGEVDVHHIGPYSPLGTRHGVQHWGDSAKQLRVSTAINRRFFYYLSADERTGDLLREQVDAVERLRTVIPGRKIGQKTPQQDPQHHASVGFGTDWGAVAAAWFTEWERTGQPKYRDKLLNSMASIAARPLGFLAGGAIMDLRTGVFLPDPDAKISVSHLSAVFGLPEIASELIRTVPQPAFRDAWLRYCRLYSASQQEQKAELGQDLGKLNLGQGHARLLAYAAVQQQNGAMLKRAWAQFQEGRAGLKDKDLASRRVKPPLVLNDVEEAPTLSTNAVAQWGLGAMGMLALDALAIERTLMQDSFQRFDAQRWAVEAEAGNATAAAYVERGALVLHADRGLTVWLRQQLLGHYEISFTRTVLADGRLSDLNFFWEAQLPQGFTQSGKLEEYDRLKLFYAGIGGNTNSTSRFRYYDGSGVRNLLQEYTAPEYLLKARHAYRVRIVVDARGTRLYVDDKEYFNAPGPLLGGGYFGFRTTQSRQRVENFSVKRIA
ncbi:MULTISPECIES: DUF6250 domain-containing protein [unclassified Duganella]|uniref:exo-rhamnogalacturonan lyase family protein n=1 Tax=unclassified Duganella TaxID=2636909 RepID=UPI000888ACAC|nr:MULTISPECIES: DUF6250 domain-containing protein [unclassified Duganella]SDF76819.1 hypothetical protein SAMN05216320_1011250 [Duganella sp. OV458]SDI52442.1 hypothetical protein SAMN05428973_101165 [Duganella sp. OV510]